MPSVRFYGISSLVDQSQLGRSLAKNQPTQSKLLYFQQTKKNREKKEIDAPAFLR